MSSFLFFHNFIPLIRRFVPIRRINRKAPAFQIILGFGYVPPVVTLLLAATERKAMLKNARQPTFN
jgi:hypothetical protein